MKKFLIATTLVTSLLSTTAIADSRHTLTIEASKVDVEQEFGNATYLGTEDQVLPTLRYGYKFQLKDFYLRPSTSYTFGDVEIKDTRGNGKSTLSSIITLEGDAGYNITKELGVFVTAGIVGANYEREVGTTKSDANESGILFGLGIEYDIIDSLSLSAKYQRTSLDYAVENISTEYEVDVDMIKIGLSYNF